MTAFASRCLLLFLLLASYFLPLSAQWERFNLPQGLPANSLVHHNSLFFTNFSDKIFRSADGVHWEQSPAPDLSSFSLHDFELLSDGTRLYAALLYEKGLYVSTDNGNTWSTTNLPPGSFTQFEVAATPGGLYAHGPGGNAVHKSTDQGATWQVIFSEPNMNYPPINSLDVNDSTILVLTANHLVRSTDAGYTWNEVSNVIKGTSGGSQFTVWAPVYYVGNDTWFTQNVFARSTDNGASWQLLTPPSGYAYPSGIAGFQDKIWMTSFTYPAKTFVSANTGSSWMFDLLPGAYNQLLGVNDTLFAAGEDGCYYSVDNGAHWLSANKGNNFDPQGPGGLGQDRFFVSGNRLFSAGYLGNDIFYTDNDGEDWHFVKAQNEGPFKVKGDTVIAWPDQVSYDGGLHFTQFPNPEMADFAIAGDALWGMRWSEGIYRSTDGGQTWLSANFPGDPSALRNIAWARQGLWAATDNGIYTTFDDGASWQIWSDGIENPADFYYSKVTGGDTCIFLETPKRLYYFENGRWKRCSYAGRDLASYGIFRYLGNGRAVRSVFDPISGFALLATIDGGKKWSKLRLGTSNIFDVLSTADELFLLGNDADGSGPYYFRREWSDIQFVSIQGSVFQDQNGNGSYDAGEPPVHNVLLYLDNAQTFTSTDTSGNFLLTVELEGADSLLPALNSPYYQFMPPWQTVSGSGTYDFAALVTPGAQDILLTTTAVTPFRPGFESDIVLTVRNIGTVAVTPAVYLPLSASLSYVEAQPAPTTVTGNELTWQLPALEPLAQTDIRVKASTAMNTPLGTDLSMIAEAQPVVGDLTPVNNRSSLRGTVVGSFDPNDKQCEPIFITQEMALDGEELIYTVRFQNTGNYEASFVIIRDTLASDLETNTATPLSASHPYRFILYDSNVIEVVFENIKLPPVTTDEAGSHGFITFSVQTKPGLSMGKKIENKASIYFDFNLPIVTNATSTLVTATNATNEPDTRSGYISIVPNPASEVVTLRAINAVAPAARFVLANVYGSTVGTVPCVNGEGIADIRYLPPGLYFVRAESANGILFSGILNHLATFIR